MTKLPEVSDTALLVHAPAPFCGHTCSQSLADLIYSKSYQTKIGHKIGWEVVMIQRSSGCKIGYHNKSRHKLES